jgi:small subunit ribosomal protein S16
MDSRNRRDGAYLEQLGVYHPNLQPAQFSLKEERVLDWLSKGAVPSDTVRSLLSKQGIMLRFDLTKRQTPPDKISEAVEKFKSAAIASAAHKAELRKTRRKGKAKTSEASTA